VTLAGQGFDIFLKDFFGQQASHVRMVFEQLELRVDRSIENVSKWLGNRLSVFGSWCLFGVGAMLSSHNRGSSSVSGLVGYALEENLFLASNFN
jgi:hypothetical protein